MIPVDRLAGVARRVPANVRALEVLRRAGLLEPGLAAATAAAAVRWGPSVVVPYAAAAARHPDRVAVLDADRSWTYRQLAVASDAAADRWRSTATGRPAPVGVLVGNSPWFLLAVLAATKAGADAVLLNTGSAGPQLAEVARREGVGLVLHDRGELPEGVDDGPGGPPWVPVEALLDPSRLPPLAAGSSGGRARRSGVPVLLTSGTTGVPKGARRDRPRPDLAGATAILERIPYRAGDVLAVPTPLFHAWGFAQVLLAAALAGTVVLDGRFDAGTTLRSVQAHRADVLVVVPVVLQRLLAALPEVGADLSSLRIVASSGSALPGPLATRWMDAVGDTLYNLYGSTEVGQATIATPADLRAAPGSAGRPAAGTEVRILGPDDRPVPPGGVGRIGVRGTLLFEGYTTGGSRQVVDGHMLTGDLGRIDEAGRLHVLGRSDDMIISGGENVYPAEVEDLLAARPEVADVAVVGVPDDEFGQRLAAFVVAAPGAVVDPEALRDHVRRHLARHEVPREVTIVDALPRNETGKVLRDRLGG